VTPTLQEAARIVLDALEEVGIDPEKGQHNVMLSCLLASWARDEITRDEFVHAAKNLLILNPKLGEAK
jgi:hypothetical protein